MSTREWSVVLSDEQWQRATAEGRGRWERAIAKGAKARRGQTDAESLPAHIESCASELATSLIVGLPWDVSPIPGRRPDVGHLYVRSTSYQSGSLLVHRDGPDGTVISEPDSDGIYVLAIGAGRSWRLAGWVELPTDLNRAEWAPKCPERPCWWIRQWALRPMDEMP